MKTDISPREVALKVLYDIEKNDAYVNLSLKKKLNKTTLTQADSALVTELVYGIIQHKTKIDYSIRQFSKIRLKKITTWIINILRLGVYQLLYLDRIPDSAACNESVKLAKKHGHAGSVKFVNGVLRSVARNKENITFPDEKKDPVLFLSTYYSHPAWLVQNWVNQYGYAFTKALCKANNTPAYFTIRTNTLKTTPASLLHILTEEGMKVAPTNHLDEAILLGKMGNIEKSNTYQQGLFQIQDESSMLVSRIVDAKPGECVMDVCSAPGGKATHLAQLMDNQGKIIAWDIHAHKIDLIKKNVERLGINNIETQVQDAAAYQKQWRQKADRVLVDAPCSGLGIIRRKPDIKWNKQQEHLEQITKLQLEILQNVSMYVKVGGVLVYSTCTIYEQENMGVVQQFLQQNPAFELEDISEFVPEQFKKDTIKKGYLQLFPHIDGTDGFFISRMRRRT